MKKILLLGSGIIILAGGLFYGTSPQLHSEKAFDEEFENERREIMEESVKRREWEIARLRDPATNMIPGGIRAREIAFAAKQQVMLRKNYPSLLNASEATTWVSRGPWNIGGRTRALGIDAANDRNIIAGGVSGGMWRSTDAGASWKKSSTPDQLQSVSCVAQDTRPGKTNTWYYGTGEMNYNSASKAYTAEYSGDGIYKSTDNGLTWKQLDSTILGKPTRTHKFSYVLDIITDHTETAQDVVYAATKGAIYRSTNGGSTWSVVLGSTNYLSDTYTDIAITPEGVFYAAFSSNSGNAYKGIWRSEDGVTWKNITASNWPSNVKRVAIGISPADESQVYFIAETPNSGKSAPSPVFGTEWHSLFRYQYISGDGSGSNGTWTNLSSRLPVAGTGGQQKSFISYGSYCLDVAVSPDDPEVVVIAGVNIFRSLDGFSSSTGVKQIGGEDTPHHPDVHRLIFSGSNLYTGSDGGVHRTSDVSAATVSWADLNNGYVTSQFFTAAIDPQTSSSNVIVGGLQDNNTIFLNSVKADTKWKVLKGGDGAFCAVTKGGTDYYVSYQNGNLFRQRLDANGSVVSDQYIRPSGMDGAVFINPFVLDPNNNNIMYFAGGNYIWRNSNLPAATTSNGWTRMNATGTNGQITAVAASTSPANIVYYGTGWGKVYRVTSADTDNPTVKDITSSKFPNGANYVSCIAVDPTNANKIIVVFSNYGVQSLYYSVDGGTNWSTIGGSLEENPSTGAGDGPSCRWVSILPMGGGAMMYYAGTSTGLYSTSFLNGNSTVWKQEGANTIGNCVVEMVVTRPSDKLVVVATHGAGVFSGRAGITVKQPETPVLASPVDKSKGIGASQTVTWNSVTTAAAYDLQVADNPEFTNPLIDKPGLTVTNYSIKGLVQGKKVYYWRVRSANEAGASVYSPTWTFTTSVLPPVLDSPKNTVGSIPQKATLTWKPVDGAKSYRLMLASSSSFADTLADIRDITTTSYTFTDTLINDKRYFWRVSCTDDDGESSFSSAWNFRTIKASSVSVDESVILSPFMLTNYPNPFSAGTTIVFKTERTERVSIRVYDAGGKEITILADREFPEGEQRVEFNAQGLSNGMYFYTLTRGGKTVTRAMQIMR